MLPQLFGVFLLIQSIFAMKTPLGMLLTVWLLAFAACTQAPTAASTPQQKEADKQPLSPAQTLELAHPTRFVSAIAHHKPGQVFGKIRNTASATSYTQVVLQILFYDQENTVVGTENDTLNQTFPPTSETDYSVQVRSPQGVADVAAYVIAVK